MKEKIQSFEDLDVYRLAENLGDQIWDIVIKWPNNAYIKSIGSKSGQMAANEVSEMTNDE